MSDEKQPEKQLSEDPTLSELFEFIKTEGGVRILPITVKQDENDTRLLLAIQGEHRTASIIMAQLMTEVSDLHDLSEQEEAGENEQKPKIIVPGS